MAKWGNEALRREVRNLREHHDTEFGKCSEDNKLTRGQHFNRGLICHIILCCLEQGNLDAIKKYKEFNHI